MNTRDDRWAAAGPSGRAGQTGPAPTSDLPPQQGPGDDLADEADGHTMRTELLAGLTSARQARSAVRQALAAWGMEHLGDDAALLTSELVANAAEHGDGTPIDLALRRHAKPGEHPGITCEVTDTSPAMPRRTAPGPDAERGRGLAIVNSLMGISGSPVLGWVLGAGGLSLVAAGR
jgi:serine/threonine-protein kinase RsbW